MKFFTPVSALTLAIALALSADLSAAASCSVECTTTSPCEVADAKTTPVELTRPTTLAACASGKFAYLKSLKIGADATVGSVTDIANIKVTVSADGTATFAAVNKDPTSGVCENSFVDLGKVGTADAKVKIACDTGVPNCKLQYKPEWACQEAAVVTNPTEPPASCAVSCTTCKDATILKTAPTVVAKPTTVNCATGKFAYLKSLTLGAVTAADKVTVAFTGTGETALTATKDTATCDGKWADVGKDATLTADVTASITCGETAKDCPVKWVGVWECQTASGGNETVPPATNATTNATTPAPSSGAGSLAGANSVVVVVGTALVALIATANFAAPL